MKATLLRRAALVALAPGCLALSSCGSESTTEPAGDKDTAFHGLRVHYMDTTVNPAQDFYQYANGGYLKRTEIPADESSWGSFDELDRLSLVRMRAILEKSASNANAAGVEKLAGDFWTAGMDSAGRNAAGVKPLEEIFSQIHLQQPQGSKVAAADDVVKAFAYLHRHGIGVGFGPNVEQDFRDSRKMTLFFFQGGLGLPEREFYLDPSEERKTIRTQYTEHIGKMMAFGPDWHGSGKPDGVLALETRLAKASLPVVEMRDPAKVYNPMSLADLKKLMPHWNWDVYFPALGLPMPDTIVVSTPGFMKELDVMLATLTAQEWNDYLSWHLVSNLAPSLSDEVDTEHFNFYSKTLNGVKERAPLWRRITEMSTWNLNFAVGQVYVKEHFSENAKLRARTMVDNILSTMKERLAKLPWMSEETRQKAIAKVGTIQVKIGYPDKWRDFSGLQLDRTSFAKTLWACQEFNMQYQFSKYGKPVDRTEWGMPPQMVNAYYNPLQNEIVFPAAILQPPFFDEKVDDALNYGGIGMVIGHELIHGFDDQGSKFDQDGNMSPWWSDEDRTNFEAQTQIIRRQYDAYTVLDSLHLNGQLTLGENIADIDGARISYAALQKSLGGKTPEKIDGFTSDQRFFLNMAHVWASKFRDEKMKVYIVTNPHSPPPFRVRGITSSLPEFYAAFGVKEGDPMWRADSVRSQIW